jgi:cell wall-associated NlpC family hydrolase
LRQMPHSRVRFLAFIALSVALPWQRAIAQTADLPDVLRGALPVHTPAAPDAAAPAAEAAEPFVLPTIEMPRDLPKPFAAWSATATSLRDSLVSVARAQIGRRYRLGGVSPEHGFDCSGLVRYVMAALHITLPRTAREQARAGVTVPRDATQLRPGDLVMFGSTRDISHVGIYVGDGRFVQASSKAGRVVETPLMRPLVRGVKPWRAARRVMIAGDSTEVVPALLPVIDPPPADAE